MKINIENTHKKKKSISDLKQLHRKGFTQMTTLRTTYELIENSYLMPQMPIIRQLDIFQRKKKKEKNKISHNSRLFNFKGRFLFCYT